MLYYAAGIALLTALASHDGRATIEELRDPRTIGTALDVADNPAILADLYRLGHIAYEPDGRIAITDAGRYDLYQHTNRRAKLHPADPLSAGPLEPDDDGTATYPAIEVAGVLVFAYVDAAGTLQVSVHIDSTEPWMVRPDDTLPITVTLNGKTLFDDSRTDPHEGASTS